MIAPSVAAIVTPALLLLAAACAYGATPSAGLMPVILVAALIVSALHYLLLGLPAVLLIKWLDKLSFASVAVAGTLTAIIPSAVRWWPMPEGQVLGSVEVELWGMLVEQSVNGVPTLWGWLIYLKKLMTIGVLFGLPAAVAFWFFMPEAVRQKAP